MRCGGGAHTLVLFVRKEGAGQRDLTTGARDQLTNTPKQRKEELLRTAFLSAVRNDATVVNVVAKRPEVGVARYRGLVRFAGGRSRAGCPRRGGALETVTVTVAVFEFRLRSLALKLNESVPLAPGLGV